MSKALPRGKVIKPSTETNPKIKVFGFKNKQNKQKKLKNVVTKVPSQMKASDFCQGCITIGSIRSFHDNMIFVDLPGNVKGTLPLTEINDIFLERLKNAVEEQAEEIPMLEDFFKVGDFIMATVTSSGSFPVDLSIRPQLVNNGLEAKDGNIFYAAIKSKEDHGFIVDLGNDKVQGFLRFPCEAQIGQPQFVRVIDDSNSHMVKVELISDSFFPSHHVSHPHFDFIRPTNILDGIVISNSKNGALSIQVANSFSAFCSKFSWPSDLHPGASCTVRPILVDYAQKIIWVSAIPQIVKGEKPHVLDVKIGSIVDSSVLRIRSGVGIECCMPNQEDLRIFIDMTDTKSDTALAAGDEHKVRLTERRVIDDLLFATDDPEIIGLPVFCGEDVMPGQVLEATIEAINVKIGVFVKLSPFLTALCPISYVDEPSSLKKGDKAQCIVLSINKGLVRISLKPKFVSTDLPKVLSLEDAKNLLASKQFTHALVRESKRAGLLVEFFNGLIAMLPASYLPIQKGQDVSKQYTPGYVVKVRIATIDNDKINVSVTSDDDQVLTLGLRLTTTVIGFTDDGVKVSLPSKYGSFDAVIPSTHFSDYLPLSLMIWKSMSIGKKLHHCVMIRYPGTQAPAVFSRKRSIRDNSESIPRDIQGITQGSQYFGYISGVQAYGSFVSFLGRASGLIHGQKLQIGDSINALVDEVSPDGKIRLKAPSEIGETANFAKYFLKDSSDLSPPYTIGNLIEIKSDSRQIGKFFEYDIEHDWKAISKTNAKIGESLSIIYVDVLSNSIYIDNINTNSSPLEQDSLTLSTVIAVFEPFFISNSHGRYIISPMINFNNRQDFNHLVKPDAQIEIKVTDTNQDIYIGSPTYLLKNDIGGLVSATVVTISGVYATARLIDGKTVKIHMSQVQNGVTVGSVVEGQLLTGANGLYLVIDPTLPQRLEEFVIGQPVVGIVYKVFNEYLKLSLSPFVYGSVHSLRISISDRHIASKPLVDSYSIGDRVEGFVIGIKDSIVNISASDPNKEQKLAFAKVLKIKSGDYAIVSLGVNDKRRLDVIDVSDEFKFNPLRQFKVGQVIDVCPIDDKSVSTRLSDFEGKGTHPKLEVGSVVKGYVSHNISGALLVRIGRGITARLPYNNIADCYIKSASELYPPGSVINVKIISKEGEAITVSSKRSDIDGRRYSFEDLKVGEIVQGFITSVRDFGVFVSLQDYGNISGLIHRSTLGDQDSGYYSAFINTHVTVEITNIEAEKKRIALRLIEVSLPPEQEPEAGTESSDEEPEMNEDDLDWEEKAEAEPQSSTPIKKEALTEEDISKLEARQLDPSAPKSAEEFASMLLSQPHSSFLWVKFIEFYFGKGDIENAIITAERALDTLPIGDIEEKSNVWIAYLNMKVLSAKDSEFMESCKPLVIKAAQTIDAKKIWIHFAEFVQQNKPSHSKEAWKQALKHCKGSVKVWISYLKGLMASGFPEEARTELKRSYDSFPADSKKLINLKSRFAVLEFQHGYLEHGRSLFESILQIKPKRFDIWNVYIDQEVKHGDEKHSRTLYDRIAHIDLSAEHMRMILKKWLDFETKNGDDPEKKKYIKKIASEYMAAKQ